MKLALSAALASTVVLASLALGGHALAQSDTILTISGAIEGESREFTLADLEAMPSETFETTTPWFEGTTTFEGVPMETLMEAVGATGDTVEAIALNDYSADVPVADFAEHGTILAYKRDGDYMSVAQNGPLFIVYPFDSDADLQTQMFYSRSVWQVRELTIR